MKFIVKSCPHLSSSVYATGEEKKYECGERCNDELCKDITNCVQKQIAERLMKVISHGLCNNCDGEGYGEGCCDEDCGTYQAYECVDLLNIEVVPETALDARLEVLRKLEERLLNIQEHAHNILEVDDIKIVEALNLLDEVGF